MSSIAYCAEISPDPALRRAVMGAGVVLALCGAVALTSLPAPWGVPSVIVWLCMSFTELRRLQRAWRDCCGLRVLATGDVMLRDRDGAWRPGRVEPDGVLLRHYGWIRLRNAHGTVFAEPLRGTCRKSHDWRRLQVIWRHIGARD